MADDASLLDEFAQSRSQAAFAELVNRYMGLVYGSALRRLSGDAHSAADIAQDVFLALASRSPSLLMRFFGGRSDAQIGHEMGVSADAVRETIQPLLKEARNALK